MTGSGPGYIVPSCSGVLLKMEVGIRRRAWQRAWRYPAYLWSLRWVYAVKKNPEVGIRRIPAYTPPIHHCLHVPPSRRHWVDIWWILRVYPHPTLGAWPQAMESVFSFSKHWIATSFLSPVYVRCSLLIAVWNESPELFISPFVVNISPSFPGLWW